MVEILLAFFAVVGIGLLGSLILDAIYFRKIKRDLPMIVDMRKSGLEEAWETMEAISLAGKYPGAGEIIGRLIVLVSDDNPAVTEELALHYLRVFDLNGSVFTNKDCWYEPYQNTPERDGTNPS